MKSDSDHVVKLVLVGNSGVGKTSMLLQFTEGVFSQDEAATVGVDFKIHMLDTKDKTKVNLTIWDTAGQERFQSMLGSYYRDAHGILVVYDVSNRESFNKLKYWLGEVQMYNEEALVFIVGNKVDLDRKITTKEGKTFAKENGALFGECSSKDDIDINTVFEGLINGILNDPVLSEATKVNKSGDEDKNKLDRIRPSSDNSPKTQEESCCW